MFPGACVAIAASCVRSSLAVAAGRLRLAAGRVQGQLDVRPQAAGRSARLLAVIGIVLPQPAPARRR